MDLEAVDRTPQVWWKAPFVDWCEQWKAGGLGFPTETAGGDFEIGAASRRLYQIPIT